MANLFKKPEMPKIKAPTPLPDEQRITDARRKMVAKETKGSGVTSTLLTSGGRETLGA